MNREDRPLNLRTPKDLPDTILSFMKSAQKIHGKNSYDKKLFVLEKLKFYIGSEAYERYAPLIEMTIDLVKALARNKHLREGLESLKPDGKCLRSLISCNFC